MPILFIVLFSLMTTFSNFQATSSLSSPNIFEILTPKFTTKVRKIWLNFWYKTIVGLKKIEGGDDVVDHVRHF